MQPCTPQATARPRRDDVHPGRRHGPEATTLHQGGCSHLGCASSPEATAPPIQWRRGGGADLEMIWRQGLHLPECSLGSQNP